MTTPITRVAIVGAGVIGASWATAFLARGMDVVASDPAPGGEEALRKTVDAQWPTMQQIGLAPGASTERLLFAASPEDAVADVGFVQENGPERLEIKRDLFRRLDEAALPLAPLASSTSTIPISKFQDACMRHPERVVLGHPFNPPHLIPLVEVGGGKRTAPDAIERALNFYRAMGKHPIHLRREITGHVANRLQAALWQEAFNLVKASRQRRQRRQRRRRRRRDRAWAGAALVAAWPVHEPPSLGRRGRRGRAVRQAAVAGDRGHVA
jgi:carnitine 3-dehydrogenase